MDFSFISLKIDKVTQPFLLNEYKYTRLTVNPHVTVNYVFTYLYPIKSQQGGVYAHDLNEREQGEKVNEQIISYKLADKLH